MSKRSPGFHRRPSVEQLRRVLSYNAITGDLFWLETTSSRVKPGDRAGGVNKSTGYIGVKIFGKVWRAHRVAWAIQTGSWPTSEIDHINGEKADNRFTNLRAATRSQNCSNTKTYKNNKSGFKGVHQRSNGRWRATVYCAKRRYDLGHFNTAAEAHAAYCASSRELHGEFAGREVL